VSWTEDTGAMVSPRQKVAATMIHFTGGPRSLEYDVPVAEVLGPSSGPTASPRSRQTVAPSGRPSLKGVDKDGFDHDPPPVEKRWPRAPVDRAHGKMAYHRSPTDGYFPVWPARGPAKGCVSFSGGTRPPVEQPTAYTSAATAGIADHRGRKPCLPQSQDSHADPRLHPRRRLRDCRFRAARSSTSRASCRC